MLKEQLDKIMRPRSIAVVGASTKEHTIGSDIMKRLQEYKFKGQIYPINPKGGIIEGLQAYTTVLEVPGDIDLAITTGYILLEITSLGLGGVWLGIAPVPERVEKADEILGIGDKLHAFALVPLGYPAEDKQQQDRFDESRIHYVE